MNSNQLPVSGGVAIFIAVVISYFVYSPADLSGVRPDESKAIEQVHGAQDVQARLWQDPFAAAANHKHTKGKWVAQIKLTGEVATSRLQTGKSTNLTLEVKPPKDFDAGTALAAAPHSFDSLTKQILDESTESKKSVNVLAVMVSAGPYPEDEERRLRRRYAVIAGLAASGYQPEDSAHIGYVDDLPAAVSCSEEHQGDALLPAIMPYEWFKNSEDDSYFLLLWLDEDAFSRKPLCKLNSLLHLFKDGQLQILKQKESTEIKSIIKQRRKRLISHSKYIDGKKHIRKAFADLRTQLDRDFLEAFKIIGPSSSHTLKAMLKEIDKPSSGKIDFLVKKAQFFSATATAKDTELIKGAGRDYSFDLVEKKFIEHNLKLFRTIADDANLAGILLKELRKRIFDLRYQSRVENFQIALVSEWDTFYGRSLPDVFVDEAFKQQQNMAKAEHDQKFLKKTKEAWGQEHIYRFSYLRGIDGRISGEARTEKTSEKESKEKTEKNALIDRPEGRSQRDYLRRLASDIQLKDQQLKSEGKKGIRAIGILGSDVYDKLMVLRVLRQRFPKAIFFTTDLDASLLHPSEFQWTRNMLIASSFDLKIADHQELKRMQEKLKDDLLQRGVIEALMDATKNTIPQFRDVYQTSVYLSTLWAANKELYDPRKMKVQKLYEALKATAKANAMEKAMEKAAIARAKFNAFSSDKIITALKEAKAADKATKVVKEAVDKVVEAALAAKEATDKAASATKEAADKAVEAASAAKEAADKAVEAASAAKEAADKAGGATKKAAGKAASATKEAADKAGGATKKAAGKAASAAKEAVDKAVEAASAAKKATDKAASATKEAADKAVEAASAAKKATDKVASATKEAADKAIKAAKEAVDKAVEAASAAKKATDKAASATKEAADKAVEAASAAKEAADKAVEAVKAGAEKKAVGTPDAVKAAADKATEAAKILKAVYEQEVDKAADKKGKVTKEAAEKAVEAAKEAANKANKTVGEIIKGLTAEEEWAKKARGILETTDQEEGAYAESGDITKDLMAWIEKLETEATEAIEALDAAFGTGGAAGKTVTEKASAIESYRLFLELSKRNISPRVYEVGRNGALDLANTPSDFEEWSRLLPKRFGGGSFVRGEPLPLSPFYPIKPAAFSLQGVLVVAACLMLFALLAFAFWCRWIVTPDMNDSLYKRELVWARWMTVSGLGILVALSLMESLSLGFVMVGLSLGYILVAIRYCFWVRNMMCKKVMVEAAITLEAAVKAVAVAIVAVKEKEEADAKAKVAIKAAANTSAIKRRGIEVARKVAVSAKDIAEQARVGAAEKTEAAKKAAKKAIAAAEAKAKIKKKYPHILKRLQEVVEHYHREGGTDARI